MLQQMDACPQTPAKYDGRKIELLFSTWPKKTLVPGSSRRLEDHRFLSKGG